MSNGNYENFRDIKVEGISNLNGGDYGRVKIEGVVNLKDDITAKFISIEGVFNAQGKIESDEIHCEGVAKVDGLIRAKKAFIEGTISLKGEKFEADKVECNGILTVDGEINAGNVVAEGVINAKEIYGDYVEINSHFKHMFGFFTGRCSKVGIIEATTVSINGVKCDTVNGHNITIGEGCKIKNLCCDGVLNIHPKAQIENITGDYKTQV